MGFVHTEITVSNPQTGASPIRTPALVDTGALHLCLPEALARQLDLPVERFRRVTFADGRSIEAPYVGPVRLEVGDRVCFVGAMVFGDEALLGAIPMEDLDLLVDPARRQVVPRDPRGPVSIAKRAGDGNSLAMEGNMTRLGGGVGCGEGELCAIASVKRTGMR